MAIMDLSLGPILLGTILNIWLYGIMVTQTSIYYAAFPRDHKWLKFMVAVVFAIDTLNSVFDIGFLWRYTITLFGDLQRITTSHWLFNVEPAMTVMVSSTTQCFFAWRIAKLTGHVWLGWLIAFSSFIQFLCGTGATIGCFIVRDFDRFQDLKVPVIIWLGLSAITDILITCILSWYLHTHRTGFSQTDDVITRLVRLTVQTGLITTVWATIDLVIYLALDNNLHLFFQLPLCKLYTNTIMSTLNSRAGWGGSFSSGNIDPSSKSGGATGRVGAAVWHPEQVKSQPHTAIQVVTTATVHRDDGIELEACATHDTKTISPDDIEAYPRSGSINTSTVRLPGAISAAAISDANSMHSSISLDTK